MDVTLVLTHRCNLACAYCYAGDHHGAAMDDATVDRAVDLLWADGAEGAQLSFFGGEPFLALPAMRRAVGRAAARARELGRRLTVQCTTNGTLLRAAEVGFVVESGMQVVVSIDGVRELHDRARPCAGGGSSFDATVRGLRALVEARARPEALMVVGPASAPQLPRSVRWLWDEGVRTINANLSLGHAWTEAERDRLRAALSQVGRELLFRRLRGDDVMFDPFARGFHAGGCGGARGRRRSVAVSAAGHVYACAPMVAADRDAGPEAALRIARLDDGPAAVVAAATGQGPGCAAGGSCACAAWLETGDPRVGGPNGRWFAVTCREIGAAVAAGVAESRHVLRPEVDRHPRRRERRQRLAVLAGTAGIALGMTAAMNPSGKLAAPPPVAVARSVEQTIAAAARVSVEAQYRKLEAEAAEAEAEGQPVILGLLGPPPGRDR